MRQPGRNPRRAFTLLEVVVVAVVSSIVFAMLARWLLTLGEVNDNTLTVASANRSAVFASAVLDADTSQAYVCDPTSGSAIRTLTYDTFAFFTRTTTTVGGTGTYLVTYQHSGPTLTRTAYLVDPTTCAALTGNGTTYGRRVVAGGLRAPDPGHPTFSGYTAGVAGTTCQTLPQTLPDGSVVTAPTGTGCAADAISVRLMIQPLGPDGGHDELNHNFRFDPLEGGL